MKKYFFSLLLLLGGATYAQNLVVNPSFEITNTNCSSFGGEGFRQDLDPSWDNANSNIPGDSCSSPDLFSACNPFATGMPDATSFGIGWQYSRTGTRHAGFIAYSAPFGFGDNYREYIQGHTTAPLVAGQTYCVSFYISLADGSPWGVENIGLYFSNTHYLRNACTQGSRINETPDLTNNCGVLLDTVNWVRLQWDYVATGGEQYFVIGNFNNDAGTTRAAAGGSGFGNFFAYYFIDDVSIVENSCCYAEITPLVTCVADAPTSLVAESGCGNPITGTWSGPGITNPSTGAFSPSVAGPGTHTITFTASCGYVATTQVVVSPCDLQVCVEANGNLTASGGATPYTWQNQTTVQDCSSCFIGCALPPGCAVNVLQWTTFATGTTIPAPPSYPIQVLDAGGNTLLINSAGSLPSCGADPCASVTISVNITPTHVTCNASGSATATPSGGTAPYTYSWNTTPVQTTATATNLSAGAYTVTVTDANGCTATQSVTINPSASAPTVTISTTDAGCGGVLGSATATPSGGTAPYTYSWNTTPVQTTQTATNLPGGNYTVTVTDANGCEVIQSTTVGQTSSLTLSISGTDPLCNGGSSGSATVVVSGGTPGYTYSWSPSGGTGATADNIPAGTYTVTVTDANACTAQETIQINDPAAATLTMSSTETQCLVNSGTATVAVTGGTAPYTYSWNTTPVQTTATAIGLGAGNYTVTVTDANGCQTGNNVIVSAANAPTITIVGSQGVSCHGGTDGTAEVSASGGTAPYTYSWSPSGGTGATASNLAPGIYDVTVVDAGGCTDVIQVTIGEPAPIVIVEAITHASCGASDGEIALSVTGGTGAYTYNWSPAVSTSDVASGLAIGVYNVVVTDIFGCSASLTATVETITSFYLDAQPEISSIEAGESVQLTLDVEPGVVVDIITWTPSTGLSCTDCENPVASPTETTTYYVTVISDQGCISTDSLIIFVTAPCGQLFVPTIFSPNGDGINDLECVLGSCVVSMDFTIFNRWGEVVFHSDNQSDCWDGTFRGKPVQTGVYVYKLEATLVTGERVSESGNINVTR